jgi:predicted nucleic acid-binding protein
MTKPLKVYLDTSILNFAVSTQDVPRERELTIRFLDRIRKGMFLGFISDLVVTEIRKASTKKQDELLKVVAHVPLESLPLTAEVKALADRYIKEKMIPASEFNDAAHIAVASIHNLDAIVSWNFEHMVKFKTRREVQGINALMGYKTIEICSPLEMVEP